MQESKNRKAGVLQSGSLVREHREGLNLKRVLEWK